MSLAKSEYFLGGVSPTGFQTHFDKEIAKKGNYTYILKGGAGTGKSSLMKRIAAEFSDKDDISIYHCSSDPNSLDAVVLKNAGIIIVDGTSPHVFDPIYAGVTQKIINLGDFWDDKALAKNMSEIIKLTDENLCWHKRCKRFVCAVSALFSDTYSIASDSLSITKLEAFSERLAHRLLQKGKDKDGFADFAQLSALTPQGYITLLNTVKDYKEIYILNDSFFVGSDTFLRDFASLCVDKGYDIIISECTLFQTKAYEHLLIPELGIAFISSNPMNDISIEGAKPINFQRFYDKTSISLKKQRVLFNKKACADLLLEAQSSLENAQAVHDGIESYYINVMDFNGINQITDKLIDEISSKY